MEKKGNKVFEAFFFEKDLEIHPISEIQDEYEKRNGDISLYKDYIYCPECKEAKLSFTHQTSVNRAYLSKLPSSSHNKDCSYNYEYATNEQVLKYITSLSGEKLKDKLESVLNKMLYSDKKENRNLNTEKKENPFIITEKNNIDNKRTYKSIRKKSLNSQISKEDEGKIFLFYGRVKLEVKKVKEEYYNLILKTKEGTEWRKKTQVFRARKEDKIDENLIYDIAILGHIEFYRNNPQIKSEKLDSILIREVLKNK